MNRDGILLNRHSLTMVLAATMLLTGCNMFDMNMSAGGKTDLSPCTASGSIFERTAFREWPATYHDTVNDVIEAHRNALTDLNTQKLQCTASDYASMAKPTDELKQLAATLPPWKRASDLDKLSEVEIAPVLLEYLRIYECSLNERKNFIRLSSRDGDESSDGIDRLKQDRTSNAEIATIDRELAIAQPTLQRALLIIGGESRLRPLTLDIECLKRTSLDIRNILGLTSQATACMPRILDARGSLRDLPPTP